MPYNPGIEYRGDKYLFQGIAGAGESLGDSIAKFKDQRKQDKETEGAYDALGKTVEYLGNQGAIPPGLAMKYYQMGSASAAEKRGMMHAIATSFGMTRDVAQQRSLDEDRKDRRDNAAGFLKLQQDGAATRKAEDDATAGAMGDLSKYLRPQPASVPAGGMTVPTMVQPKVTPEMVMRFFGDRGIAPPPGLKAFIPEPQRPAFRPEVVDLGDGVKAMTTSEQSAVPLREAAARADAIATEDWMVNPDREAFLAKLEALPIAQVKQILQIRRGARPEEFRNADGGNMEILERLGLIPPAPGSKPSAPSAGGATGQPSARIRYSATGERIN